MILIPGTKSTIMDLMWLRQCGLEAALQKAAASGTLIFGICGGYQMMGELISDPEQVEASDVSEIRGMGLLRMETVFRGEKVQTQVSGVLSGIQGMLSELNGMDYAGYEIHMGRSEIWLEAVSEVPVLNGVGTVYGTYVHGFFDAPGISDTILKAI